MDIDMRAASRKGGSVAPDSAEQVEHDNPVRRLGSARDDDIHGLCAHHTSFRWGLMLFVCIF